MKPKVSFLIPTMNENDTIRQCIESLLSLDYPKDKVDIVVVDSGSTDGTIKTVREYKQVRLYIEVGANKPEARNKAIEKAKGEYLFNYSGHVVAQPNLLRVMTSKFKDDIKIVGCPNYTQNKDKIGRSIGLLFQGFMAGGGTRTFTQNANFKTDSFVEHVPFCLYHKEVFEYIGRFNPILQYGQDAEFNLRARQRGYKILYTPDTYVDHYKPTTLLGLFDKMYKYGKARSKIIGLHPDNKRFLYLLPNMLLSCGLLVFFLIVFGIIPMYVVGIVFSIYICLCVISGFTIGEVPEILLSLLVYPLIHFGYVFGMIKGYFEVEL